MMMAPNASTVELATTVPSYHQGMLHCQVMQKSKEADASHVIDS